MKYVLSLTPFLEGIIFLFFFCHPVDWVKSLERGELFFLLAATIPITSGTLTANRIKPFLLLAQILGVLTLGFCLELSKNTKWIVNKLR